MKQIIKRTKNTDITAIRAYYKGEVEQLTEHQETVRKRLLQAQTLLARGEPTFLIINVLKDIYQVSESQAFRDLRAATSLYGDMRKAEKEGIRWLLYDMILEDYVNARKNGDTKAMAAFQKNLITVSGVDREDPEMPDFANVQPPPVVMIFNQEMQLKIDSARTQGVVDLTELLLNKKGIEDVEFTEDTGTNQGEDTRANSEGKK